MAQNFYPFVLVGNRMEISKQCVYVYKIAGNCDIEGGKNILEELFKENFQFFNWATREFRGSLHPRYSSSSKSD